MALRYTKREQMRRINFFDFEHNLGITMADPTPHHAPDTVESVVRLMPIVLPLVGAVLMFLLAFIAVYMA